MVGKDLEGYLKIQNGTGTLTKEKILNKKKLRSKKLDKIIFENNINKIDLIKVDTDGFDISVLESGLQTIKKNKPFLFFEYLNINPDQLDVYLEFISKIKIIGYNNFIILDNYGNILSNDSNINEIKKTISNRSVVDIFAQVKINE